MSIDNREWQIHKPNESVIDWLLGGDPAIRWQVMRDLTQESDDRVAAERSRIASEGWGARVLGLQSSKGNWGGEADARNWLCTSYTLLLLKDLGLDPLGEEARRSIGLVRDNITWPQQMGGLPYFDGETEPCVNGWILGAGSYFGEGSARLVDRLLGEQLEDGGWNCNAPASRRSSFHSTICVLEGLLEYEKAKGETAVVTEARIRAHEYLLERRMLRSLSSGEVIDLNWTRFSFPTTWHYDVLRGLDYLRSAGVKPDERVAEAVGLVAKKQDENGKWPLENAHSDRVHFDMEGVEGEPSRWNTLRALRVLDWYSSR
ncbi:hypothetical protein [Paenibacillus anseongense]|uniref:hypothetical protein n=1 Tax=Paenibacillus anseongense TaxID=2682845 RepID=UPI002DBA22BA|nr:hypothetical protein [Paenibacillus anseongense]MEC0267312.1 hypothetical protein [Paenibacillus anseongense]